MYNLRETLKYAYRDPQPPAEFQKEFRQSVTLSNCRRLKAVTLPIILVLLGLLVLDFVTFFNSEIYDTQIIALILRAVGPIFCVAFFILVGPLRSINDLSPRHSLLWKGYMTIFLLYAAITVGVLFPIRGSVSAFYILLLGAPAFLTMTPRQVALHLFTGFLALTFSLSHFAPHEKMIQYHMINTGILLWVGYALSRINSMSAYRDFMNRKVIEEKNHQLEDARDKAQAANRAKSEFLAAISHEIRTPMNSILGMTEIALHTKLDKEQREYIETARESGLLLMDIINDMLDFSRIEARKFRLISTHFDLPAVIQSAVKTVRIQAERKGLSLDFETMEGTPRYLKGDPGRLRQVLMNLLDNAITYTEEGSVRLTVGLLKETSDDRDRPVGLRFSVKDTGCGIPQDHLDSIFDPFAQVGDSTARFSRGSGLGLTISRTLIQFMGGTISVHSTEGKGSEFIFTARFAPGDSQRASETDLIDASWNVNLPIKPSRVLLVDDNPVNVKVELLHLNRMGMTTTVADSGAKALDLLAENDYDIVLMDLEMPGMDGYEATRIIRSSTNGNQRVRQPDIPILAVTAHALGEVRDRCERIGMDGFVAKPVGFGELGSAMRQLLGGSWNVATPDNDSKAPPVLDIAKAASQLGVTRSEVAYLLPKAVAEIAHKFELAENGLERSVLREVALQSHTLKSVAASIGAEATRRAAVKLENASRRDDGQLSVQRLEELRRELFHLQKAAKEL
ncbi:ATP-binding protein [Pseudodesulfovibrio sp. zrk46]|uniref:ATP-binding protein n=1 Tax=Pseudodesulfovibrio sp. zrk46 TaxID=2725288 RepID=UPI001448F122|nr:ATP-binding protein [Pseudodesulfovibrio sp. zrk46]QJB55770.1 response regulator [Pseudodesulfovibrio sp. zrk46]